MGHTACAVRLSNWYLRKTGIALENIQLNNTVLLELMFWILKLSRHCGVFSISFYYLYGNEPLNLIQHLA